MFVFVFIFVVTMLFFLIALTLSVDFTNFPPIVMKTLGRDLITHPQDSVYVQITSLCMTKAPAQYFQVAVILQIFLCGTMCGHLKRLRVSTFIHLFTV